MTSEAVPVTPDETVRTRTMNDLEAAEADYQAGSFARNQAAMSRVLTALPDLSAEIRALRDVCARHLPPQAKVELRDRAGLS